MDTGYGQETRNYINNKKYSDTAGRISAACTVQQGLLAMVWNTNTIIPQWNFHGHGSRIYIFRCRQFGTFNLKNEYLHCCMMFYVWVNIKYEIITIYYCSLLDWTLDSVAASIKIIHKIHRKIYVNWPSEADKIDALKKWCLLVG